MAKLEVGIIKGSILVIFSICSGMHSKVVLSLAGAILNAFLTRMGSICYMLAEIEIFRKCAKIGSVSGECFAPICAHVSRRHVHSVISLLSLLRPDTFLQSPRPELLNPGSQYWEQGFPRRTASDLAYHERNLKAKVGR